MSTLTVRAYAGSVDLPAILHLFSLGHSLEQLHEFESIVRPVNGLSSASWGNVRLWEENHQILGLAYLTVSSTATLVSGSLNLIGHPTRCSDRIFSDMLSWAEQRLWQTARNLGLPAQLRCSGAGELSTLGQLLESHGFRLEKQLMTMWRSLILPIPAAQLPAGYRLSSMREEQDAAAWATLYNRSFLDHCHFQPITVEQVLARYANPSYRSELDLVAIDPEGEYAALCRCWIDPDRNSRSGCNEGYIHLLATRWDCRRQGLARAMLLAGMQRLWEAGVDTVRLSVDARNFKALNLYLTTGFRRFSTQMCYTKML